MTTQTDLPSIWDLWLFDNSDIEETNQENFFEKIEKVLKVKTTLDFQSFYSQFQKPKNLPSGCEVFFFKEGIKPLWEDPKNKNGGSFFLHIKKTFSNRIWENVLVSIVAQEQPELEKVNGVIMRILKLEVVFFIWTQDLNISEQKFMIRWLKETAGLSSKIKLEFKPHPKSKKQNNQIYNILIQLSNLNYNEPLSDHDVQEEEFIDQVERFIQNLNNHLYVVNYGYHLCFEKFKKTILALRRLQQVTADPKLNQFVQGYFFSPKYLSKMEFESKELRNQIVDFIGQKEQFEYLIKQEHENKNQKSKRKDDYFQLLSKQTLELKGFDKKIFTPAMVFNIMSQFGKVKDVIFHQFYPYQCFVQFDDVNNQQKAKKSLNKMNLFGSELEIRQIQERDNKFLVLPKSENLLLENDQLDISFSQFPSKTLSLQTFYKKMNAPNIKLLMDPFYRPKKIIEFEQNSLKSFLMVFKNKKQAMETISIYDQLQIGRDFLHFFFIENNQNQLINVINKKNITF